LALKVGCRGDNVKRLQSQLTEWGFPLKTDGIFGKKTKAAVIEFQKGMGLVIDGIVGNKTGADLHDEIIKITHFRKEEFQCRCKRYCNGYFKKNEAYGGTSHALLILLERIRAEVAKRYGFPIPCNISSTGGYRCPKYNKLLGGASISLHLYVKAADIFFKGVPVSVVNSIAKKLTPYGGIGLNGNTITHVDVRGHKSRWYYN
jgi:peptidoglycan hydrolase-like protein with peptidoglycan-binding domain